MSRPTDDPPTEHLAAASLVRPARAGDIPELLRLRALLFDSLADSWGDAPQGPDWQAAAAAMLAEYLSRPDVRVLVIPATSGLACCGIGTIEQRLPSPYNPLGRIGHLFGVATDLRYRRRGLARTLLTELLAWFDGQGLRRVDLNASREGMPLYRSLGFVEHSDPAMRRYRD